MIMALASGVTASLAPSGGDLLAVGHVEREPTLNVHPAAVKLSPGGQRLMTRFVLADTRWFRWRLAT